MAEYTDSIDETNKTTSPSGHSSLPNLQPDVSKKVGTSLESPSTLLQTHSSKFSVQSDGAPSLCIAVIGATGELARKKIFPALFALYYSGFLPEVKLLLYLCFDRGFKH